MSEPGCMCERIMGTSEGLSPRCFGEVWLFEGAPAEAWESISGELVRRRFEAGEPLFRQGDEAVFMFLVKAGAVKLWKTNEEGRAITLDIRKGGDLLGENVLIGDGAGFYPVSATCLDATLVCGLDKATFEALVTRYPAVGLAVIKNLSRRVEYLSGKLGALSEPTIEERLHKVLWSVASEVGEPADGGRTISFPLTHEEIGFLVGAHRVSVTRALTKLKEAGKIRTKSRTLFVAEHAG